MILPIYKGLASEFNPNPLSVYAWFNLDMLTRSRTISVNYKNGAYLESKEYEYTWDGINAEDWQWFSNPLVSYTRALEDKGELKGQMK